MIYIFAAFAGMLVFALLWHIATKKYLNPYKLIFIFGKKGSGKTTLLVRYAQEYLAKGWTVYSTENIPGTIKIDYTDVGYKRFPENSCLIIDEVGMIWDNRSYKTFPKEVRDYFKLQRHYKNAVIMASQTFDIDKKLRDLTDEMYLVENKLRVFSYAKRVLRRMCIIEASGESASRIDENLEFDSLFWFWCGSRKLSYIPKWGQYYNSFDTPELPELENTEVTPYPYIKKSTLFRKKSKKHNR